MNYLDLKKLKNRLYFDVAEFSQVLGISQASARVLCSRYVKKGLFARLKNNFYVLDEKWDIFQREDFLKIANFLQVPSYISFMTALSLYEVTTQIQRDFYESVSLKRSKKFNVRGVALNYYKFKKEYYFDFVKKEGIFIATKEKAFVDSVYLCSLGRYKLDFDSLDVGKFDKDKIQDIIKIFPERTKNMAGKLCKI
ncbi:MAG: hypothetical protein KKH29_01670 [Candidatus Omnitrophica bacterium]|nr:hypothetical protein [Candidatus Omnitrophota bacterium]MBU4472857.1 hypothetical protein [Candidatus Omnitrophota bacterium]MCG2706050.1 hypothetical protein [Candidatus Omnitrophota bacterium]